MLDTHSKVERFNIKGKERALEVAAVVVPVLGIVAVVGAETIGAVQNSRVVNFVSKEFNIMLNAIDPRESHKK